MGLSHQSRSGGYADNRKHKERPLSRAALEVLAIIAYHQPVTRAEIEEIEAFHFQWFD